MNRAVLVLAVTFVFLVGVLAGVLLSRSDFISGVRGGAGADKLEDVLRLIGRAYIEPPADQVLVDGAIRGMTDLLDPYSIYVDSEELQSVREEIEGNFGGVGIWFEMVADTARVVSVVAEGPSERAGVMPGDRIVAINDSAAIGINSLDIQRWIKGPPGTTVSLTLYRPALHRMLPVLIQREVIPIRSITADFLLDSETAYIRIGRFASGTVEEFRRAVSRVRSAGGKRLLIDLRDNPGGIMEAAAGVADELLPEGLEIVRTEERDGFVGEVFRSTSDGVATTLPLIILVNRNSASASEILAGAVQDNDRGLVVGRPTFGKGLVQTQFQFRDGTALHLTVARYFTPSGRPIQNRLSRASRLQGAPHAIAPLPAESLTVYTTVHGRSIRGGEGIYPDHVFEPATDGPARLLSLVSASGLDLRFARRWFDDHEARLRSDWTDKEEDYDAEFSASASMWTAFLTMAEVEVPKLRTTFSHEEVRAARTGIETLLKARVAQLLYGPRVWQSIASRVDPEIAFAGSFWDETVALPLSPGRLPADTTAVAAP